MSNKMAIKMSFLWTFRQFCCSQKTMGNVKCKIFTSKFFVFHGGTVVHSLEFMTLTHLLNHRMPPTIIETSYGRFCIFLKLQIINDSRVIFHSLYSNLLLLISGVLMPGV